MGSFPRGHLASRSISSSSMMFSLSHERKGELETTNYISQTVSKCASVFPLLLLCPAGYYRKQEMIWLKWEDMKVQLV